MALHFLPFSYQVYDKIYDKIYCLTLCWAVFGVTVLTSKLGQVCIFRQVDGILLNY